MANVTAVLNQLEILHRRSLPQYLAYAAPAMTNERAQETLHQVVADQLRMADRIAGLILEKNGTVWEGEFPMYFTGYHDLSFDFLLKRMIELQTQMIESINGCVAQLNGDTLAQAVAQESLGEAKGHLDCLRELAHERTPSASPS